MIKENAPVIPTKRRIIAEALTLFSERGYEAVTVADIAKAVGVKAPALYKHFKSKLDIFNAIFIDMKNSYDRQTSSMNLDGTDAAKDRDIYLNADIDGIVRMSVNLFLYFIHDENVRKFRKMLAIEMYGNKQLAAVYNERFVDFPLSYQSAVFGQMIGAGVANAENTRVMALQYYAPVFLYITLCDCQPEREAEAVAALERHFRQFIRIYGKKIGEF